jgi:hypothetical protein
MKFGPHRSGGTLRRKIHYNEYCPHAEKPLPGVRLAWLQGRATGDFTQALIEIGLVETDELSPLEAALLEYYHQLILWEQGAVALAAVIEQGNMVIERAATTPDELYGGNVAAEMRAMQVLMYTLAQDYEAARRTLDDYFSGLPDSHIVLGLYYLAAACLQYAEQGPLTALRSASLALTYATKTNDPCFLEVCAVNIALMQAADGQYDAARHTLADVGLPLDDMPPFWLAHRPEVLEAELATHCYAQVAQ